MLKVRIELQFTEDPDVSNMVRQNLQSWIIYMYGYNTQGTTVPGNTHPVNMTVGIV